MTQMTPGAIRDQIALTNATRQPQARSVAISPGAADPGYHPDIVTQMPGFSPYANTSISGRFLDNFQEWDRRNLLANQIQGDMAKQRQLELDLLRAQLAQMNLQTSQMRVNKSAGKGISGGLPTGNQIIQDQDRQFELRNREVDMKFEQARRKLELDKLREEIKALNKTKEEERRYGSKGYRTEAINDAGWWRTLRLPFDTQDQEWRKWT